MQSGGEAPGEVPFFSVSGWLSVLSWGVQRENESSVGASRPELRLHPPAASDRKHARPIDLNVFDD